VMGHRMKRTVSRRQVIVGASALAVGGPGFASAQTPTWPTRPVRIIVPVTAGTATDLTARIFGEKLSAIWRQGIAVENKPGADGLIALGSFVSARDDHALLFSFSTAVSLNPQIHAKLPYDAAVDLVPITTTSEVLFAVAVRGDVPEASMAALGAYARSNPGKMNWAAAPGLPRFVLERHWREQGLDLTFVGYNQTGSAVQDLGEGRLQVMIAAVNTLSPVIENQKARLLVITSTDRAASAPAVPHAIEAGFRRCPYQPSAAPTGGRGCRSRFETVSRPTSTWSRRMPVSCRSSATPGRSCGARRRLRWPRCSPRSRRRSPLWPT
jgi:tripartite-type tricarboxylate transporter receptor subunit TctC